MLKKNEYFMGCYADFSGQQINTDLYFFHNTILFHVVLTEGVRMAAKSLTQAQIITKLAEANSLPKKQAKSFLDSLAALAYAEAKKGFTLPGLGKLVLVNRKARKGRNPATGETIKIPAKKVVKFRVAKAAKDAIVGGAPAKKAPAKAKAKAKAKPKAKKKK
jgi:DNA-binding protein HU-beta